MSTKGELVRSKIISILADGEFHSGEEIGRQLSISRVAVAKHIKVFDSLGLDVFSVTGRGYRLSAPIDLLSKSSIEPILNHPSLLTILSVTDSTNEVLKQSKSQLQNGQCCVAEAQTAGRGRQGKQWQSPFGASLYLSMHWSFPGGYHSVNGLSLAVGIVIAEALTELGIGEVGLKWPNDVYVSGHKLCGVLVELAGLSDSACQAIVGLGINMALPESMVSIDQPWTDISRCGIHPLDRNHFCADIINRLHLAFEQFESQGFARFLPRWERYDYLIDKPVHVHLGQQVIRGVGRGINALGAMQVQTDKGLQTFFGGEVSVRRQ